MGADLDRTRPIWRQVAEVISKRIGDETYPPGRRVPGIVELIAEFGIGASTAQKALAHLRDTGEVGTELGLGTFIADPRRPARP